RRTAWSGGTGRRATRYTLPPARASFAPAPAAQRRGEAVAPARGGSARCTSAGLRVGMPPSDGARRVAPAPCPARAALPPARRPRGQGPRNSRPEDGVARARRLPIYLPLAP